MHAICPNDCPQKRSFKHFEINFGRLSICFSNTCQTSQQFQCALPSQSVISIFCIMYSLFCFCRLQSLRILQRKRKRILKHFSNSSLLQNQVTFTVHIYIPIHNRFTENCLGQSVWVQKSKDCEASKHPCYNNYCVLQDEE